MILQASKYKILDSKVNITLQKSLETWWPRITSQPQKPQWLKVSFQNVCPFINQLSREVAPFVIRYLFCSEVITTFQMYVCKGYSGWNLYVKPRISHLFLVFVQIDFDRWRCDPEDEDPEEESRNVMNDYPGMYERLQKDEIGYRKGKFSSTQALIAQ